MQLKKQVEWGLHCCLTLAELPHDEFLSAKDLALAYRLPKPYLAKALQALSRGGVLAKAMGPMGGYRLARQDNEITVLNIVEAIEGNGPLFKDTGIGQLTTSMTAASLCPINKVMMAAEHEWRAALKITLQDLRASRTIGRK